MSKERETYSVRGYLPTIGIECHVQLKTKTKLFAGVGNDARDADPNTLISHICLGMPGALPVLNEKVIEYAVRAALAFDVRPQKYSYFERKHYFYPDLPKGYQITQLAKPIIVGGSVTIDTSLGNKRIPLNRVQIEEDAGKNTHPEGTDYSLVDLNRAGTPLLEIVSEPDIHSAEEAKAYAKELYLLMRYADVSDADMYHGNMRFDVNVSVSKDNTLGTRTETKNLNSFKSVEKAVQYEIERQISLLEKGESISQETRGWDDAKQRTFSQRSKEEAHDYRYFPEPDVPPIELKDAFIDDISALMPPMPADIRSRLQTLDLDKSTVDTIVDSIHGGHLMFNLMEHLSKPKAKRIANWLASEVQARVTEGQLGWGDITLDERAFVQLATMVEDNLVSSTNAKAIVHVLIKNGGDPHLIAKEQNLLQDSDEAALEGVVDEVIKAHTAAAQDVRNGENKAIGFLVGQVMKQTQGRANPGLVQKILKQKLGL